MNGTVTLGNAAAEPHAIGFSPAIGNSFTLIDNDGGAADPVIGTFNNLPEGATFTSGGKTFQITYQGGDGNDVVSPVIDPTNPTLVGTPGNDSYKAVVNGVNLDVYENGVVIF